MPPSFYHRRPTPSFFLPTPWLLAQPPTHPPTPTLLPPRLCLLCPILSRERGRGMARTALSFAFFSLFLLFSLLSPDRKAGDSTPLPSFFSRKTRGGEEVEEKPFIAFPTATIAPLPLFLRLTLASPPPILYFSFPDFTRRTRYPG